MNKLQKRLQFLEKMVHVSPWPDNVKVSIEYLKAAIRKEQSKQIPSN